MRELIKVNKNIHRMALETQFTASNLTNYAVFSNTQLREYKTSEEIHFFQIGRRLLDIRLGILIKQNRANMSKGVKELGSQKFDK